MNEMVVAIGCVIFGVGFFFVYENWFIFWEGLTTIITLYGISSSALKEEK